MSQDLSSRSLTSNQRRFSLFLTVAVELSTFDLSETFTFDLIAAQGSKTIGDGTSSQQNNFFQKSFVIPKKDVSLWVILIGLEK
jgi:hypothetical protein